MNYQQTLEYLYNSTPMFQQVGSKAYKEGLENTLTLDAYFSHPHRNYRSIHIAGTNGKGSCSHTLAAVLQSAGYKVGLYTSPHLLDFSERIRINGKTIEQGYVVEFVEKHRAYFESLQLSFFELTTAMAFCYFADMNVDVAVIEVGLGGRLDCTNIIRPDLSIITNISKDHIQLLGNTLADIAKEKAGIIKAGIPVVIGETTQETKLVFINRAREVNTSVVFAEEEKLLLEYTLGNDGMWLYQTKAYPNLHGELRGLYQVKNANTLLSAIKKLIETGYRIEEKHVRKGFQKVCELTGLLGRWQKLESSPTIVCDTGHNMAGISYLVEQLRSTPHQQLRIVIGMVNDKDINGILSLLPQEAVYYFTKATVQRALPEDDLQQMANKFRLRGNSYPNVSKAIEAAKKESLPEDLIFVGGSTFIVADLLSAYRDTLNFY